MILDLDQQYLCFQVNDGDTHILFKDVTVGKDINYCMAVYIDGDEDCIELLKW